MKFSRFQADKKRTSGHRLLFSGILFFLILFLFSGGIRSLSRDTSRRQKEILEQALNRSIISCYALEGHYPESLAYLTEHYGLSYDRKHFFVDYRLTASNLYPDVTILEVN